MVILDAFATMYILIDAGLPTIIARDVPRNPSASKIAVRRVLKLQALIAIPFLLGSAIVSTAIWDDVPTGLLLACALVAFGHIMSYPHKAMLRALGEARIESILKLIERIITTALYYVFLVNDYDSPTIYACGFAIGVFISLIGTLWIGEDLQRMEMQFATRVEFKQNSADISTPICRNLGDTSIRNKTRKIPLSRSVIL